MTTSFLDIAGHSAADNFGWHGAQIAGSDRITLSPQGSPQRGQNGTLKIVVQPNDHPVPSSGERNELLNMFTPTGQDVDGNSPADFIAVSLNLPVGYQPPTTTPYPYMVVGQLHAPDDSGATTPAWALDVGRVPGRYTLAQWGGDVSAPVFKQTDLGPWVLGEFVDFMFQNNWAADNTGRTAAWTRTVATEPLLQQTTDGVPIAPWNTPTLYKKNGIVLPHYFKAGLYRGPETFISTIYRGPLARSLTFEGAAAAAFG